MPARTASSGRSRRRVHSNVLRLIHGDQALSPLRSDPHRPSIDDVTWCLGTGVVRSNLAERTVTKLVEKGELKRVNHPKHEGEWLAVKGLAE